MGDEQEPAYVKWIAIGCIAAWVLIAVVELAGVVGKLSESGRISW